MPRARRQLARCACLDCTPESESINAAFATTTPRPDPPPKCLVVFHTNINKADIQVEEDKAGSFLPHIDSIVREGGCGLLSVNGTLSDDATLSAAESLRQLLSPPGEVRAGAGRNDQGEQSNQPSAATLPKQLFERFQGMRASLCSPMQHVRDIGARHGLSVYDSRRDPVSTSSPQSIAQWAAQRLGFGSPSNRGAQNDNAVFVHVDGQLPLYDQANVTSLEWVDAFIKAFDETQNAKMSTLTIFVGGPIDKKDLSPVTGGEAVMQGGYSFLQPFQSAESSISHSDTMFIVSRRLQGVVRRDAFARLRDFALFHQGAYSTMPLDRLLPDVAYKIGCAKKYGS